MTTWRTSLLRTAGVVDCKIAEADALHAAGADGADGRAVAIRHVDVLDADVARARLAGGRRLDLHSRQAFREQQLLK